MSCRTREQLAGLGIVFHGLSPSSGQLDLADTAYDFVPHADGFPAGGGGVLLAVHASFCQAHMMPREELTIAPRPFLSKPGATSSAAPPWARSRAPGRRCGAWRPAALPAGRDRWRPPQPPRRSSRTGRGASPPALAHGAHGPVDGVAIGQGLVLELAGGGVGGLYQHKDALIPLTAHLQQGLDAVGAR
mgnify:CR=1 FL=1